MSCKTLSEQVNCIDAKEEFGESDQLPAQTNQTAEIMTFLSFDQSTTKPSGPYH
jgi:hypothetical protein